MSNIIPVDQISVMATAVAKSGLFGIKTPGVADALQRGVPADQARLYSGALVVNLINYQQRVTVPRDEPVEIWNGGTGFMLIQRQVLEGLADKLPAYSNDVVDLSGAMKPRDKITEYFACSIEEGTNRLLSEDYHFCLQARKHGYKVLAAPWANLGHMGSYLFEGGLLPAEQGR
jgi:hypothetical protein